MWLLRKRPYQLEADFMFIAFAFLLVPLAQVASLVDEKQKGLKDLMVVSGLSPFIYTISWIISEAFAAFVLAIVMALLALTTNIMTVNGPSKWLHQKRTKTSGRVFDSFLRQMLRNPHAPSTRVCPMFLCAIVDTRDEFCFSCCNFWHFFFKPRDAASCVTVFLLLWLFLCASGAVAFLLSSCFSRASTATTAMFLTYVGSIIVFLVVGLQQDRKNRA